MVMGLVFIGAEQEFERIRLKERETAAAGDTQGSAIQLPIAETTSAEAVPEKAQAQPTPGIWVDVVMEVTAYCACESCCGPFADGITASGSKVTDVPAFVAAGKQYPFGTVFKVPGYNDGKPVCVLDRGAAIKGNKLDTYHETHSAARKFGRKTITVKLWKQGETR